MFHTLEPRPNTFNHYTLFRASDESEAGETSSLTPAAARRKAAREAKKKKASEEKKEEVTEPPKKKECVFNGLNKICSF